MLWFVGLGVSGFGHVSPAALDVMRRADAVYLEQFTSPVPDSDVEAIRRAAGGLRLAKRWQVEDGSEILGAAKDGEAALLSYGDPYIATTHIELRTRAAEQGIETGTIHAASALTAIVGECGLHFYKVGRVATVMGGESLATPYRAVCENMSAGCHTVLLLEYDQDGGSFLRPGDALAGLLAAEEGEKRGAVLPSTYCIVASRVGSADQDIVSGRISSLAGGDYGPPPHTVIVPGPLHFTEGDALAAGRCLDAPEGNALEGVPARMIAKYVPMVREALREVAPLYSGRKEYEAVLENAELYIRDAEKFLEEGRGEVAVLSIGYADGLVDALRMAGGMEPKM